MNREEKSATIEEIAAQIEGAEAIFAVDYRGISVAQAAELRAKLREADASFRVVKNRLTKLAADKAGEERLSGLLQGPTALAFVRGDTAQAAKAITTFNKQHAVLSFKGGFMAELILDEEKFTAIARLPTRAVLDGQLAGVVASPLTGLVRGLGSMISGLALQLGQIAERGLLGAEAAQAEPPAAQASEESAEQETAAEEDPVAEASDADAEAPSDESGPEDQGAAEQQETNQESETSKQEEDEE